MSFQPDVVGFWVGNSLTQSTSDCSEGSVISYEIVPIYIPSVESYYLYPYCLTGASQSSLISLSYFCGSGILTGNNGYPNYYPCCLNESGCVSSYVYLNFFQAPESYNTIENFGTYYEAPPASSGTLYFYTAPSGTTNPSGSYTSVIPFSIPVTAIPSFSYSFSGWSFSPGVSVTSQLSSTTVTLTLSTGNLSAWFSAPTASSGTLNYGVIGNGTITPSGSYTNLIPFSQSVTATPNANNYFTSWTYSSGVSVASQLSSTTATLTSAIGNLSANFASNPYITMQVSGTGTTIPTGSFYVSPNSTLAITGVAGTNYSFGSWTASGTSFTNSTSAITTTVAITGNTTIQANFIQDPILGFYDPGESYNTVSYFSTSYEASAAPSGTYYNLYTYVDPDAQKTGGYAQPSGITSVLSGSSVSLTATPMVNNAFYSWTLTSGAVTTGSLTGDAILNVSIFNSASAMASFLTGV